MVALPSRAAVAAALEDVSPQAVSGQALAECLGISRVAVNKHVAALRELGYVIDASPRAGYRLRSAPDLCIPEQVAPRLRDPLWAGVEGGLELASTNDDAKRLARAGAPAGTLVVAGRQSRGRGRFDRQWDSPAGGVYASAILRPQLAPSQIAPLSLVVALGIARALDGLGVPVGLKWPNDIEAGGRKLGGILLEMAAEADRVEWVLAGFGLNVAPSGSGASVREFAPDARVAEVAAVALDGVAAAYREFLENGFSGMQHEYQRYSTLIGSTVTASDSLGTLLAEGRVLGVDADGALLLAGSGGKRRIVSGEVTLRR